MAREDILVDAVDQPARPGAGGDGGNVSEHANKRSNHQYLLPSTFEERGAYVPFTTPSLNFSRVRKDWRDRLELVMEYFSDGEGSYVFPWAAVPEVVPLSVHDTMLHKEIMERKALDPQAIRIAAFAVAETGLAGPDVLGAAKKALKQDREAQDLHQVILTLQVIREVEHSGATDLFRAVMTEDGQETIRATLAAVAPRLNVDLVEFRRRLDELGHATYAVGFEWSPERGRLRCVLDRLYEFRDSTAEWAVAQMGVPAEQARFCSEVATHTLGIAAEAAGRLDKQMAKITFILTVGKAQQAEARRMAARLSWLLDGWEPIVETWAGATSDAARIEVLPQLIPVLPTIPRDEVQDKQSSEMLNSRILAGKRRIRALVDWRTGEIDVEMFQRIEAMKAKLYEQERQF